MHFGCTSLARAARGVTEALPRQAPKRHIGNYWLAQSKPGWSAQACSRQAQSASDGDRWLVPAALNATCMHGGIRKLAYTQYDEGGTPWNF